MSYPLKLGARSASWARASLGLTGLGLLIGCSVGDDQLVPPTAAEDKRLPQIELTLSGRTRALHLETFGEPGAPVLLVFHGGWGSDYRALLPLAALQDRYFVVLWDARGSGLSERIGAGEISERSYAEEVHAIKQRYSPDAPVSFVGYSSGGQHAAIWLTYFPEDLDQLILVESDPFHSAAAVNIEVPFDAEWVHNYLWQNEVLTPGEHALSDYKLTSVTGPALGSISCDPEQPSHYPLWRMGAYTFVRAYQTFDSYDYRPAMRDVAGTVLLIATECGPLDATFQRAHVAPVFDSVELVTLPKPADHSNLFSHSETAVLQAMRGFLHAYREEPQ